MSAEDNKRIVERFYERVWNRGNVDAVFEIFADDYERHDLRPSAAAPVSVTQLVGDTPH